MDNPDHALQPHDSGTGAFNQPTSIRWWIFGLACGTSWLLYLHRYTFALIKPELQREYGLGAGELGLLDGGFGLCYLSFQVPFGILADFAGVRIVLFGLIMIWSLGLAMHAWAPSPKSLWFARATLGIGQSGTLACLIRLTKYWYPTSIRTTVQGWIGVFAARSGGMCANLLFAALLVGTLGLAWRSAIYVFAGMGLLFAFVFFFLVRNSPKSHPWANAEEAALVAEVAADAKPQPSAKKMTARELFSEMHPRSIVNLLCVNAQTIFSTIADNIYSSWIPLFLIQVHELEYREMGLYSALPLLGGACGGAVGGYLNDWLIRRTGNRRWSRSLVGATGKGLAAILLVIALVFFYDRPYLFCAMLFFIKFVGDTSLTTTWGAVSDIGGRATASVFAYNNSVASIFSLLAPVMYGYMAEYVSWTAVFITVATSYVLCASSWLLINCTIPVMPEET